MTSQTKGSSPSMAGLMGGNPDGGGAKPVNITLEGRSGPTDIAASKGMDRSRTSSVEELQVNYTIIPLKKSPSKARTLNKTNCKSKMQTVNLSDRYREQQEIASHVRQRMPKCTYKPLHDLSC